MNEKLESLYDYILHIKNGEGSIELFKAHEAEVKALTTMDLFELFERLLEVEEPKAILPYLDKLMHIFSQGLLSRQRPKWGLFYKDWDLIQIRLGFRQPISQRLYMG